MPLKYWMFSVLFLFCNSLILLACILTQFTPQPIVEFYFDSPSFYFTSIIKYQSILQTAAYSLTLGWILVRKNIVIQFFISGPNKTVPSYFGLSTNIFHIINKNNDKRTFYFRIISIIFIAILEGTLGAVDLKNWLQIFMTYSLLIYWFFSECIQMRFCYILHCLRYKLEGMRQSLLSDRPYYNIRKIEKMLSYYSKLIDYGQKLNSSFSFYILLVYLQNFLMITSNVYLILEVLLKSFEFRSSYGKQIGFISFLMLKSLYRYYEIWSLIKSCVKLVNKVSTAY